MELYESIKQVVALVGFDEDGKQTVISICMPDETKKTVSMIYEAYPQTTVISQYELTLKAREQAQYKREIDHECK